METPSKKQLEEEEYRRELQIQLELTKRRVAQILKQGAQKASEISDPVVQQVENLVGLSAG